jgi:hypothetical protein
VLYLFLVALAVGGAAVVGLCRKLGLSKGQTTVCALVAAGGTAIAGAAMLVTVVGDCWSTPRYDAFAWSPRIELCEEPESASFLGLAFVFLVPPAVGALTAVLWARGVERAPAVGVVLLTGTLFLPYIYVNALPVYHHDDTPIFHNPYLRPATDPRLARACYAYGIVEGPNLRRPRPGDERRCVDLERSPASVVLTGEYDEGNTPFSLEFLGYEMSENGMEPGATAEGLVVARVYTLPGPEARRDSELIPTWRIGP